METNPHDYFSLNEKVIHTNVREKLVMFLIIIVYK